MHKIDKSQHEKEQLKKLLKEKEDDMHRSHEDKVANRPLPDLVPHQKDSAKEVA